MEPDSGVETPPSSSVRCVDQAAASRVAGCIWSFAKFFVVEDSWPMQCVGSVFEKFFRRILFPKLQNAGCWSLFDQLVSFFCWGFEVGGCLASTCAHAWEITSGSGIVLSELLHSHQSRQPNASEATVRPQPGGWAHCLASERVIRLESSP